jgi:hypothetical protein
MARVRLRMHEVAKPTEAVPEAFANPAVIIREREIPAVFEGSLEFGGAVEQAPDREDVGGVDAFGRASEQRVLPTEFGEGDGVGF